MKKEKHEKRQRKKNLTCVRDVRGTLDYMHIRIQCIFLSTVQLI